mgnify:CR=1 FL=1
MILLTFERKNYRKILKIFSKINYNCAIFELLILLIVKSIIIVMINSTFQSKSKYLCNLNSHLSMHLKY